MKTVRASLADGTVKTYVYEKRPPAKPAGHFLRGLFNQYSASPEWRQLAAGTQSALSRAFIDIEDQLGWMRRDDVEDRTARTFFFKLRDDHAAGDDDRPGSVHRADRLVFALRSTLTWALERGLVWENRAQGIAALAPGGRSSHAEKCYSRAQEAAILAGPRHLAGLYLAGVLTGLRRHELTVLDIDRHFDGEWCAITPRKTQRHGIRVLLPWRKFPPLEELFGRLIAAHKHGPLLRSESGQPWSDHNASSDWHRFMVDLGYARKGGHPANMRLHDTRHTTSTRLVEAGCTEAERGAWLGQPLSIGNGADYVARTRQLSLNAAAKWWTAMQRQGEVIDLSQRRA